MKQMSLQVLDIDEFHFYLPEIGYLTPTPLECSDIQELRIQAFEHTESFAILRSHWEIPEATKLPDTFDEVLKDYLLSRNEVAIRASKEKVLFRCLKHVLNRVFEV